MQKSKVSFYDKVAAMKHSSFVFTSYEKTSSSDGEIEYLVFECEPIAKVTSSHSEVDPDNPKSRVFPFLEDVLTVQCNVDDIKWSSENEGGEDKPDEGFILDDPDGDGRSGRYNGNLFLDISINGIVWLTRDKLAKKSKERWSQKRTERFQSIMSRVRGRGGEGDAEGIKV